MTELKEADYQNLADFRYQIRRFLHFSEEASRQQGLEPQQHQMILAVHTLDRPDGPTVGRLAEFLLIRHHSAVGLIDRLAKRRLVERVRGAGDHRQVRVQLTASGEKKLRRLSEAHREELRHTGPALAHALGELLRPEHQGEEDAGASPQRDT